MFQEDVYSGILPYFSRSREERFVSLTGNEQELEKLSSLCGSLGAGHPSRPERSVVEAIQAIALRLAHYGTALFEKLGGSDDTPLTLSPFSPEHVWIFPGVLLQIVPRQSWAYTDRKFALIRSRDVWRVKLPRQLGTPRRYRAILAQLSAWPTLGPDFLQSELERRRFPQDFSVGDYSRLVRLHQYRATRPWGWAARDFTLDHITEFYLFWRLATFKWAQAILREHIVSELNTFMSHHNIGATITLQNLPAASALLEAREKLRQGTIDFGGINKVWNPE